MKNTILLAIAFTLTSCDCQQATTSVHQNGDVVHLRLTGEKVMVIRHVYPPFCSDGVYDVRHKDGRISEVKPFEITE